MIYSFLRSSLLSGATLEGLAPFSIDECILRGYIRAPCLLELSDVFVLKRDFFPRFFVPAEADDEATISSSISF
jgi:hypothetical protein